MFKVLRVVLWIEMFCVDNFCLELSIFFFICLFLRIVYFKISDVFLFFRKDNMKKLKGLKRFIRGFFENFNRNVY